MIKRENIKGKYYLVARERGKIRSKIRWNNKVSKEEFTIRYIQKGSFKKNTQVSKTTNFYQVTTYGEKRKNKKGIEKWYVDKPYASYQYLVVAEDKDKRRIEGTSRLYPKGYPKSEAKKEAYENLYRRTADGTDKNERDESYYTIIYEGTITYAKR